MAQGSKTSQGLVTLVRSRSYQGYLGIKDQGTLLGIKESSLVYFYIQDIWSLVFIFVRLSDRSHGILGNPINRGKLEYLFLYQGATALGSFIALVSYTKDLVLCYIQHYIRAFYIGYLLFICQ